MKRLIRKLLMGNTVFTEYSKITTPDDIRVKVYLGMDGEITDVSQNHWILCIEPIMYGVWIEKNNEGAQYKKETACFLYFGNPADNNTNKIKRNAEAVLELEFVDCIKEENGSLLLLKLKKSSIYHFSFIKEYLLFYRYYKGPGFSFAKFKSFVSAYSYPRRIRLVSFRQDDYYSIFPMDLVGDLGMHKRYVFGLRHTNAALPGILATGKLVVAEVPFAHREIIYALGKYHTASPPPLQSLPFDIVSSKNFGFYIPNWAESYKEIKILETRNLGSHMLLWGEITGEEVLRDPVDHLFLVHFLHYLHQKNKGLTYRLA